MSPMSPPPSLDALVLRWELLEALRPTTLRRLLLPYAEVFRHHGLDLIGRAETRVSRVPELLMAGKPGLPAALAQSLAELRDLATALGRDTLRAVAVERGTPLDDAPTAAELAAVA